MHESSQVPSLRQLAGQPSAQSAEAPEPAHVVSAVQIGLRALTRAAQVVAAERVEVSTVAHPVLAKVAAIPGAWPAHTASYAALPVYAVYAFWYWVHEAAYVAAVCRRRPPSPEEGGDGGA